MGCLCKSVTGAICDGEGKVTMSCLWYLRLNHLFRVHPIRVQELVKKYRAGLVDGKMCREKTTTINAFYFWISTNSSLLKLETHRSSHKIWTSFLFRLRGMSCSTARSSNTTSHNRVVASEH